MTDREAIDVLFNEWKCIDRNDGIHCDRKCESCDLVMDVGIIREAFNMAISALESQEAKHSIESSLTQKALDTISRQAAIALANSLKDDLPDDERIADTVMAHNEGILEYQTKLSLLPSAHPEIEERKEESAQNVPKEDLISRKAAIDAPFKKFDMGTGVTWIPLEYIEQLPSAQPEPQWIPCSERLPESKHEDLEYPTVIVCCGDGAVTLACYYESTKEWGTGEYYDRIINPVAWMPLPKPYRAERRTDEGD